MVKCSECGYLATWLRKKYTFREASKYFRETGKPEDIPADYAEYLPQCFVRQFDLANEVAADPLLATGSSYSNIVSSVITKERPCLGITPWSQGFHPKEHQEMLFNKQIVETQRKHANRSLIIACLSTFLAVAGTVYVAYITNESALVGAEATIKASQMQIEAQKEMSKQVQPINVTVNVPADTKITEKPGRK